MQKWYLLLLGMLLFTQCGEEGTKEVLYPTSFESVEVAFDSLRVQQIDSYFSKKQKAGRFNGTVLIARGDSVFRGVYGFANYRKKDSLNIDTRFQLASVSKPITALAVMQLIEQRELSLTDSVEKFIPDWPFNGITVQMLLSHRSGLTNYMYHTDEWWKQRDEVAICNKEAVQLLCELKPEMYYRPDTKFDYNNTNYMLLAAIVEKISGLQFETYMSKYFFNPLGMKNTFIKSDMTAAEIGSGIAIGHDKRRRTIAPYYLNGTTGDKGVYTTVEDLYTLHKALLNGEVVKDSTLQIMFQPTSKFNLRGGSYGLGFRLQQNDRETITYHNGWWRGFKTYFIHNNEGTVIVLTNWLRGDFIPQKELLNLLKPEQY